MKVGTQYPGRSDRVPTGGDPKRLPASKGDGMRCQKSAEGIVGVGRDANAEGPNKQKRE